MALTTDEMRARLEGMGFTIAVNADATGATLRRGDTELAGAHRADGREVGVDGPIWVAAGSRAHAITGRGWGLDPVTAIYQTVAPHLARLAERA